MQITTNILRDHLQYSAWASDRLAQAAATLSHEELYRDFGTADRSVLGTLVHVFSSERLWLRRVQRAEPIGLAKVDEYGLSAIIAEWPEVYAGWQKWGDELTPELLAAPIDYKDLKGRPHQSTPWEIVSHVVNHSTHHRGQASGFLRTMGKVPPPLDLIAYHRVKKSAG